MKTLKLPAHHVRDWLDRRGYELEAIVVSETARTITVSLSSHAFHDLVADAEYYVDVMGPSWTGDIDYRGPARTLLRKIAGYTSD